MKVLLLGAGAMGRLVAKFLACNPQVSHVTVADALPHKVNEVINWINSSKLSALTINFTNLHDLIKAMKQADVTVACVPYFLVYAIAKAATKASTNCLDLGGLFYYTRKQMKLDEKAKKAGITYIQGCGLSPGVTNVLARYAANKLDKVDEIHIKGGAPPPNKKMKKHVIKFLYSPATYLEQFTKRAVIFRDGKYKKVPPEIGYETIKLPYFNANVGVCYCLHSELATLPHSIEGVKSVDFKITYDPEAVSIMKIFHQYNLTSDNPLKIKDVTVKPRDVLMECLNQFMSETGSRVWLVEVIGEKDGRKTKYVPYVVALDHPEWNASGVGYATAAAAEIGAIMIARGDVQAKGIVPPETALNPDLFIAELAKRNITCYEICETISQL